jgi:hypothetical protein
MTRPAALLAAGRRRSRTCFLEEQPRANVIPLHELLDKIDEDVEDDVDDIAGGRCSSAAWPRARPAWWPGEARRSNTRRMRWTAGRTYEVHIRR